MTQQSDVERQVEESLPLTKDAMVYRLELAISALTPDPKSGHPRIVKGDRLEAISFMRQVRGSLLYKGGSDR